MRGDLKQCSGVTKSTTINCRPGEWTPNGLRFATKEESDGYGANLLSRWTLAVETRSVKVTDDVNYVWKDGKLINLETGLGHVPGQVDLDGFSLRAQVHPFSPIRPLSCS